MSMSSQPQRGRSAPSAKKPSPLRIFYILVAVIAVVGIALAGIFFVQQQSAAPAGATGATPVAPLGPSGRTADGFYYKGSAAAKVVVTEYADFQ